MRHYEAIVNLRSSYVEEFIKLFKEEGQTGVTDYYHGAIVGLTLALGQDSQIKCWTDIISCPESMYNFLCQKKV